MLDIENRLLINQATRKENRKQLAKQSGVFAAAEQKVRDDEAEHNEMQEALFDVKLAHANMAEADLGLF